MSEDVLDNFISNDYNKGACAASNQGVVWALSCNNVTHILVMANDHVVTPNWLEAMLSAPYDCVNPFVFHSVKEIRALSPNIGNIIDKYKILRLKYLQEDNKENMEYVLKETYTDLDSFSSVFTSKFESNPFKDLSVILWPGLIMYKIKVLQTVGLKDEEFLKFDLASYADIDYYVRVFKKGFTSGLVMTSYVHHWGSITTRKLGLKQEPITGYKNNESGAYMYFIKKWGCNPHNIAPLLREG